MKKHRQGPSRPLQWLPALILVIGGLVAVGAWYVFATARDRQLAHELDAQTAAVEHELTARLDGRIAALSRMRARWEVGGRPSETSWRADAQEHYDDLPGYRALAWVDPSFRLAWVVPRPADPAAVGFDVGGTTARAAMDEARAQRAARATPPVPLGQGTRVFVFFPLFVGGEPDGFVLAVLDPQRLLATVLRPEIAPEFGVAVFAGGRELFARGPTFAAADRPWSRDSNVAVPALTWQVRVWLPREARAGRLERYPEWVGLGAAWLMILLAVAVSAAQRAARSKRRLADAHGKQLTIMAAQAQTEARLAASELRFRQVVEHVGAVFWLGSIERRTLEYVSPGYERIWGRSCASLYESPASWIDAVHPEDRPRADIHLKNPLTERPYDDRHYRIIRPDGTLRWIRDRAFVVRNSDGSVRGIAGLAEDVTELQTREDALRRTRKELEVIVSSQPDLFLRLAEHGTVLEHRPGHAVAMGLAPAALLGKRLQDVLAGEAAAVDAALERLAAGSALETVECALTTAEGVRRFETRLVQLPERRVLALVRDCTERHDAENLLRGETTIFGMVARHAPRGETLAECCRLVELVCPGALASIVLCDAKAGVLRRGASPSLPEAYVAAVDGYPIGPRAGGCGTAAHLKLPVIVADIATDPLWEGIREPPLAAELRACWSYPMIDKTGEVLGVFAVYRREARGPRAVEVAVIERVRDLATIAVELLLAEQALRLTQLAVDTVADLIFQIDSNGRLVEVNPAACRRLGYTRAELLTMSLSDIDVDYPIDTWPSAWAEVQRRKQWRLESRHRTKTGEIFPVDVTANYVEHEGRSCSYAVVRDISAWKASVAALEASEERLRLATDAGRMGTWEWDAHTDELRHSPTLLRLLGLTPETAAAGREAVFAAIHVEDRPRVVAMVRPTRRQAPIEDLEFRVVHPDGTIHWLANHSRIHRDGSGRLLCMVGIVTDISERKREQHEREGLMAELRAANGMLTRLSRQLLEVQENERRDLSRDLHDEMGQCITAAKINIDLLCRRFPEVATQAPVADTFALLDHIMQHVRRLCLQLRPSVLDDLGLGAAIRWYVHRQAERIGWTADVDAVDLPRLPERVQGACFRTVQEALTNVMRHARAQAVAVELRRVGDVLVLRIRDDGVGFDPSAPTAPSWEGGGLGLLGMRERLSSLGGTLTIQSAPGAGTLVEARIQLEPAPDWNL